MRDLESKVEWDGLAVKTLLTNNVCSIPRDPNRRILTQSSLSLPCVSSHNIYTNVFLKCIYFYFMFIGVLTWMSVPLKLELQRVVGCYVGAGNWTRVLWKNSQCALDRWAISPAHINVILKIKNKIKQSIPHERVCVI